MNTLGGGLQRASRISIVLSLFLIIFEVLAIALPIASSVGIGHIVWKLVVAVFYIAAGALLDRPPGSGRSRLNSRTGNVPVRGRCGGRDRLLFRAQKWRFTLDAAGWNCHPGSGFHDLESMARGVVVGDRDASGISMVMTGTTRLMMALAGRKLASHVSDSPLQNGRPDCLRMQSSNPNLSLARALDPTSPAGPATSIQIKLKGRNKSWLQSNRIS